MDSFKSKFLNKLPLNEEISLRSYKADLENLVKKYSVNLSNYEMKNIKALEDGAATFTLNTVNAQDIKTWVKDSLDNANENADYFDMTVQEFKDLCYWTLKNTDKVVAYFNAPNLKPLKDIISKL